MDILWISEFIAILAAWSAACMWLVFRIGDAVEKRRERKDGKKDGKGRDDGEGDGGVTVVELK